MTNQIKFTRDFHPGYAGAEGWGENPVNRYAENPYFAFYEGEDEVFDIIIDNSGVSLYGEGDIYYNNGETYSAWTAGVVAQFIENFESAYDFIQFAKANFEYNEQ